MRHHFEAEGGAEHRGPAPQPCARMLAEASLAITPVRMLSPMILSVEPTACAERVEHQALLRGKDLRALFVAIIAARAMTRPSPAGR
jgi:hypothetical protein